MTLCTRYILSTTLISIVGIAAAHAATDGTAADSVVSPLPADTTVCTGPAQSKFGQKLDKWTSSRLYQMTSIGVNVFGPNGDYLADMIRNDTVLEDGIDSIEDPVIPSGETYERTLEIPATKSGTYTLEVIDVGTDEIFRVPVDIKVKD